MNCWHCERTAQGVCKFCGRALCQEHVKKLPYILSIYVDRQDHRQALVVNNALYCGVCQPRDDPIHLEQLDR